MTETTLPRLPEGSVDWDHVFDAPETGLVARIEQSRSSQDLQSAMQLILKTLFNREGDAERRAVFTNLVSEILVQAKKTKSSAAAAMAEVKARVIQILHSIKEDRQKRARKALAAKAKKEALGSGQEAAGGKLGYHDRQPDDVRITLPKTVTLPKVEMPTVDDELMGEEEEEEDEDFGDIPEITPTGVAAETFGDSPDGEAKVPDEFFADVVISLVMDNLAALRGDMVNTGGADKKLPFILSPAFAPRFEDVLRNHVLPGFTEGSYVAVSQMASNPKPEWLSCLTEVFSDPSQSLMMWERWQMSWLDATAPRDEPPPPYVDPTKQGFRGVMGRLLGSDDVFIEDVELTQEEWEEAVEETRQENLRASKVWSLLTADSPDFLPPLDSDNHLLMEIFRSNADTEEHIKKLRQMAKNPETAGRAFDAYLPGKDLDLPLLVACYRFPDELMSGEKTLVATFVAGLDRRRGEATLPLCCRYLGDAMGNRFAEK